MEYPSYLIPKANFKLITWGEWLTERYLLRYTPGSDLIDSENGKVKLDYIYKRENWSQGKDLSTNLLGIYKFDDCYLETIGNRKRTYFDDLWLEGESVDFPLYMSDFVLNTSRGAFYLKIGDILNQEILYNRENEQGLVAVCKVIHTPTRANFWHFSIRWWNDEGDIMEQSGNWIQRMLKTTVRTFIQQHAIIEQPTSITIQESLYTQNFNQEVSS